MAERERIARSRRWVVKIGSALLTQDGQGLAREILELPDTASGVPLSQGLSAHPPLVQVIDDAFCMSSLPNRAELDLGSFSHVALAPDQRLRLRAHVKHEAPIGPAGSTTFRIRAMPTNRSDLQPFEKDAVFSWPGRQ